MPQTMRVGISPSVLIAVLIPLITDATAKYPFFIDLTGSSGANAPEIAPTRHDFASSTPSISPPLCQRKKRKKPNKCGTPF